jgi:integrase
LRVTSGKSQAVKRDLPMTAAVYDAVAGYLKRTGKRKSGWLFESPKFKGRHYSQKLAHDWHHAALKKAGLESFEPYCLRHTTLTRLAKHCRNPYAVAKAAGHSSIVMTYRYIHPEKEEI